MATKKHGREIKALLREIEKMEGWRLEPCKNGHTKIFAPDGDLYICGGTPSDYRAIKNVRAWVKRKANPSPA